MTAELTAVPQRRSPLGATSDARLRIVAGVGIEVAERPFLGQILLRMPPDGPGLDAISRALDLAVPTTPNRLVASAAGLLAIWMGPDEWLIAGPGERSVLEARIANAVRAHAGTVVDVSGQRTLLELRGPAVPDVLAGGCGVDLDPRRFDVGVAVQTLLARVDVIIGRGEPQTWHVAVRTSFARYLADWLIDAIANR